MSKVRSNVRFSFGEVLLTIGVIEALMRESKDLDNRVCTCPNFFDQVDSCWITCSEVLPHGSGARHATGFSLNYIAIGLFYTLFVRKSVVISSLNLLKFWETFRQQHDWSTP
jgi:hypothetical protein